MNPGNDIRQKLWSKQQITGRDVDYSSWEKKKSILRQMSDISRSCLFTVDVFKETYDFASIGFSDLFGYKPEWLKSIEKHGNFFEEMTHPDDLDKLIEMQISHSHFIYSLAPENRNDYSTIYKFRMSNSQKKYLNVISRQRVVQQDANGKAWIILGEVNILPGQAPLREVLGSAVHLKTGQIIHLDKSSSCDALLSERETEVLSMIRIGYLSKEIADKLCISINTVNNHRKNIIRKLEATNSVEAINIADRRGYFA